MSRNIRGITIEIGASTTGLEKALKNVNKVSREIGKELGQINRSLKFNPGHTELLSQKQKVLGDQISNTRDKLKQLKDAEKEVQQQFKQGDISAEQYRAFRREIIETESKLKHYKKQVYETVKEQDKLGKALQSAGKHINDFGKNTTEVGKSLSKKLTLPVVGIGAAAAKLGIDFEKSMSEVQAVTGATAEEMELLEEAAREAGATTDKSARDAADALQYMGLAGWDVETSQKALMPMLKLSSAANMELGRTTDLVTDGMSAMGIGIDGLDDYLDILAETSRNSNTSVEQLGEAFVVVGGRLSLLEVETSEAATALGILGDNGIKGSEAGRGLNAILTNLTAPTGRAKEALEELGISAFDSAGEFIGIDETLKIVEKSMDGMTMEQQNMYMSMIAGKEHSKTFNALMSGLGDGFDNLSGKVSGADGALDEMYDTMTDNTMGAIDDLKSALEELALKLWDNLKPAVNNITELIQGLTDKFNALSPEQQENIVKIGLMVAAIGPALIIIGKLITIVGTIIGVFGKLVTGVKLVGAAIGMLTGPIGIAIAAITAIIAVGVLLYKNWDTVKQKAGDLWTSIKNTFNKIRDFLKGIFDFKWELPKLKLPKINISGKFSLAPPSVPKFGIKWNKLGGIFRQPTVLPTLAGLQGFAEPSTGGEAIMPLNQLPNLMADAMHKANTSNGADIVIQNMNVRKESDIQKIARELNYLQGSKRRGGGRL